MNNHRNIDSGRLVAFMWQPFIVTECGEYTTCKYRGYAENKNKNNQRNSY